MEFAKNVHLVIGIQKDGKHYAYARTVSGNNNLFTVLQGIPDLYTVNVCTSHKQAAQMAFIANLSYINNGTHMYSQKEDSELDCVALPF